MHDVAELTDVLAQSVLQPALTDDDGERPGGGDRRCSTQLVRRNVLSPTLVRVKFWSPDGTVLYSDEAQLIGRTFALDDEARRALTVPQTDASISDLDRPENQFERGQGELLEVYRPVWTPGGHPLLFETYFRYDIVTDRSEGLWRGFAGIIASSLIALLLLADPDRVVAAAPHATSAAAAGRPRPAGPRLIGRRTGPDRRLAARRRRARPRRLGAAARRSGAAGGGGRRSAAQCRPDSSGADSARPRSPGCARCLSRSTRPTWPRPGSPRPCMILSARSAVARQLSRSTWTTRAIARLDGPATEAVLRVAQEAVRNAVKHADAANVTVRIAGEADLVVLEVDDDGIGFDVTSVATAERAGHLGLRLMADAAASVGREPSGGERARIGANYRMEVSVS